MKNYEYFISLLYICDRIRIPPYKEGFLSTELHDNLASSVHELPHDNSGITTAILRIPNSQFPRFKY